jgi:predicted outer membrane repeat protein
VNLSGESESSVILDAEGLSRVISKNNNQPTTISDLTITGGHTAENGGGLFCGNPSLKLKNVSITNNSAANGGGFYCSFANPSLENVSIAHNSASYSGGGLYCDYESNPAMKNVSITNNSAGTGGGIYCYFSYPLFDSINRCNICLNNAATGNDLYLESWYLDVMKVVVDTFTVLNPTSFHAWPRERFSFDILNGKIAQVNADLYVSPDGNNDNIGLTADDPLKNLNRAYSKMLADSLHPLTINLLAGTYSRSGNDEIFPLQTYDYISLSGESESGVILDAEGQSAVLEINDRPNINISNLTITGGNTGGRGGGVSINNCSPHLQNVTISNNSSSYGGGGIACDLAATPVLENVTIKNNSSSDGGGIWCLNNSAPILHNVTISNNSAANEGGGIYCSSSGLVFDSINRCNIYLNTANTGRDLYSDIYLKVVVDTFSVLYPKPLFAMPFNRFSFDILHGMIPQANADIYVSPEGDDANSGLDAANPLKTIQFASAIVAEDSQHPNTIRLLNGTYSSLWRDFSGIPT